MQGRDRQRFPTVGSYFLPGCAEVGHRFLEGRRPIVHPMGLPTLLAYVERLHLVLGKDCLDLLAPFGHDLGRGEDDYLPVLVSVLQGFRCHRADYTHRLPRPHFADEGHPIVLSECVNQRADDVALSGQRSVPLSDVAWAVERVEVG